jgi:hypothetical protein
VIYDAAPPVTRRAKQNQSVQDHLALMPNPSLHLGPATAGGVSPVCASGSIVTHRAYTARLRGPGELER